MFKIFPAQLTNDRQKVPLLKGWRELATTDANEIKKWQEFYRDRIAFWGIPCGKNNGIIVLDIDIKTNGWETLKQNNLQIPDTLTQKTLNGGQHFIFKYDPNRDPGNKVGFLPGLDIRSEGGWIAFYSFIDPSKPILDAPQWLYDLATLKKAPATAAATNIKLAPEIALAIFQSSIENIRNAPAGESNNTLNVEAFKVGQLVSSGSLSRDYAEQQLFLAAKERGKSDYEAHATIKSGLDGGVKNPLTSPFGLEAPKAVIDIPAPPSAAERWTPRYLTRLDLFNFSKLRKPQLFRDWSTEDIAITTADGGTGKSTLKLYEAICLALGDNFLGLENVQPGAKTLFITGEDTSEKLAAMLGAIMKQMGILDNEEKVQKVLSSIVIKKDADLCLIAKDKQGFLYPNPDAMRKLEEAIQDIKPKMIIFDPISSFWGSESMLNDMNKAVTRFMSSLVEKYSVCIEMINHMGKSSSANKDMSQFAGRGGSGLPSNSRVCRVFRSIEAGEYKELTGIDLDGDNTAMIVQISKFSDGSSLLGKSFIITRKGYLFDRVSLTQSASQELEKQSSDNERVFNFIKKERDNNMYPTRNVVIANFMNCSEPLSKARIERALTVLEYTGYNGRLIMQIQNPDVQKKDKALAITDMTGREL